MGRKIYAEVKKPYFSLKHTKKYNVAEIYAELIGEEDNPWLHFASKFLNSNYICRPIKSLDQIKLADILFYMSNEDQVNFIIHLSNFPSYNPNIDFIPISDISKYWLDKLLEIKSKISERKDYFFSIRSKTKKLFSSSQHVGLYFEVDNIILKDEPFLEYTYLDFYIHYDFSKSFLIIKTNPFYNKRMSLDHIYNKINEKYPDMFYKHGANYFIKIEKNKSVSKKIVKNILKMI